MLRDYQQRSIDELYDWLRSNDGHPCLVLPTGCHAKGHSILMQDGTTKAVEDISIGDKVMGPDGKPRNVIDLHTGWSEMLHVKPKKGEPFVVNKDHIFSLYVTPDKPNASPSYVDATHAQMRSRSKYFRHRAKLWRSGPISFIHDNEPLPIAPWVVGALIGDGALSEGTPKFCTPDSEVVSEITREAERVGCEVKKMKGERTAPTYSIIDAKANRCVRNEFTRRLESIGIMGCRSGDKYIPHAYKTAAIEDRLEIIAGLIDTDGYLARSTYDWISKSETLADDMVFMCRSVGLAAFRFVCEKGIKSTSFTGTYYRVCISGDIDRIPVRLGRKKAKERKQKKNWLVSGFSVYEEHPAQYFGFEVDGDHLYLDGSFTAHHNSGKSHIVAALCKDAVSNWPETRILMLTHVKELIEQNAEKMQQHWPGAPMGIYSAGVGQKDASQSITFAGIQSLRNKPDVIGWVDLIIIDECHLPSHKEEGGYRELINALRKTNPKLRVIGLTATPWRLGHGLISEGGALFDGLIEPVTIEELIHKGHLAPLRSKSTDAKVTAEGVGKRGGEYIESQLQEAVNRDEINEPVVDEIIARAEGRRSWLVFSAGVEHAERVAEIMRERGISTRCITGKTPKAERARILEDFKAGNIRALTNANVLTTGFDAPNTDLVAFLRPTMSPSLYAQMAGRGMRVKEHTDHCLVLDFAGLVAQHGPVTNVKPPKKKGESGGEAPIKVCETCLEINHASVKVCTSCGAPFPEPEKEPMRLHNDDIMGRDTATEVEVSGWFWSAHNSKAGNVMIKVTYYPVDIIADAVTEYFAINNDGAGGARARRIMAGVMHDAGVKMPSSYTMESLAELMNKGQPPASITHERNGKYYNVKSREWT